MNKEKILEDLIFEKEMKAISETNQIWWKKVEELKKDLIRVTSINRLEEKDEIIDKIFGFQNYTEPEEKN